MYIHCDIYTTESWTKGSHCKISARLQKLQCHDSSPCKLNYSKNKFPSSLPVFHPPSLESGHMDTWMVITRWRIWNFPQFILNKWLPTMFLTICTCIYRPANLLEAKVIQFGESIGCQNQINKISRVCGNKLWSWSKSYGCQFKAVMLKYLANNCWIPSSV